MANTIDEKKQLLELRKKIFIAGYKGGMAHFASCFSCLEMIYALYLKDILKYDPKNPKWDDRDRFILSKGHAGLALYSVLLKAGLISDKIYDSYLQNESFIGGEPCMRDCEWIEATTGSLGHGLSIGLGMAIGLKMNNSRARVYVMLGDGECEEGTIWEAAMLAHSFSVDNLVAIMDCNKIQKMDCVENIIGEAKWNEKWKAFGWNVKEVDGHDMEAFKNVMMENNTGSPRLIIAHTIKGKGLSIMENNPSWHFKLPGKKELKVCMNELNIDYSELE